MVSLSISASKDTKISEVNGDTNYGSGTFIDVAFINIENDVRRVLLEFDLSSLIDVPIENISTATLNLYNSNVVNVRIMDFRRIDNNTWTESGVTWNNQPTSTDYNIEDTWSSTGYDSVSVKSMLIDAIIDGHSYLGIFIKYIDESDDDINHQNSFNSDEIGSNEPSLDIEYDTYSQTLLYGSICKNLLMQNGWGEVTMTDHNCPSPCDAATFTFKTAWGSTYNTVLLNVGDIQTYNNGSQHHSFKLYSMTADSAPCDHLAAATIEEKYWEDDCYVKTTGDNDRNGRSWTEAWKTVDQGANETFDGQEMHIGFGTYNNEPANNDITPINFGTTGIKYTPEIAGTGGGTGNVIIERN